MTFQKLVIGASMAIGVSAIATAPAHALSLTFNNANEIKTYTGGSNGNFIANDTVAASQALTDGNVSSNVELWYTDENPTSNVGFTATEGNYSATVSSVTASDWSSFSSQWLGDLLNTYTPFKSVWNGFSASTQSLITSSFPSLGIGDPNIGSFQFGQNGGVELQLVGDLDVKTKLSQTISTDLGQAWDGGVKSLFPGKTSLSISALDVQTKISLLQLLPTSATLQTQINQLTSYKDLLNFQATLNVYQGKIGASEIAKVVTDNKTYYAYSFNSTASGITASDDGVSYSAYYTWNTPGYTAPTPPSSSVPEPSVMLGLLGVAGVFVTQRKFKKVSI
ncbi:NF038130 family PEP-CTERM protein [Nostoc sp. NOS(2021)]|uniref:NF038130 family PEP-CTERM protein n=1 Tax=Nostoc sp. NOS(2021) TaxID=2815407 RepID=UPI0025DC5BE4|nr:NF038130 family PEP-CTERM protein [Nostoc sp. NOS(2021)]